MSKASSFSADIKTGFGGIISSGAGRRLLVSVFLFLAWSIPSLLVLNQTWRTAGVEHGYMLVLMALAIAVQTVRSGRIEVSAGSPLGTLALAFLMLASAASFAVDVLIIPQFVWPAMVFAAILAAAGWRAAVSILPALLMLHFTIPIWQDVQQVFPALPTLNEALRKLTTSVVSVWVSLTGIPAFIEGNFIALPSGTFEIAEGCSGRSYFLVAVELGLFYGFMYIQSWRRRAIILFAAMSLALVANWVRVYSLILIGHFTEMESRLIADHGTFGWILFGCVVFPMLFVGMKLERQEIDSLGSADTLAAEPARENRSLSRFPVSALQLVLIVGIVANLILFIPADTTIESVDGDEEFVAGYEFRRDWTGSTKPQFAGPGREVAAILSQGTHEVGVYIAVYASQKQGSELINLYNRPLGDVDSQAAGQRVVERVTEQGQIPVTEYRIDDGLQSRLVWYVMTVAGKPVASAIEAKKQQLLGRFTGRRDAAALILSMNCSTDCESIRPYLDEALGPAREALARALPD